MYIYKMNIQCIMCVYISAYNLYIYMNKRDSTLDEH